MENKNGMICPICGRRTNKYAWIAYAFTYDEGYKRTTIDYCCHECIERIVTEINYLQLQNKGKLDNIGITEEKYL